MSTPMTPKQLAAELSIDPKNLRAFLRRTFPRAADSRNTAWNLTADQTKSARDHFTKTA